MFNYLKLQSEKCRNFRQLSIFLCLSLTLSVSAFAQNFDRVVAEDPKELSDIIIIDEQEILHSIYQRQNRKILASLNPYARSTSRGPASLIPNEDITPMPIEQRAWISRMMVDDEAGVLNSLREDVREWQEIEEYASLWNIESTGLYQTPDDERKESHIRRELWRYLDRRLSEEINDAEEGSTLHAVGRAEQAVRPESSEVEISENYKLSFRVRPLQGRTIIELENPYIESQASVSVSGRVDVRLAREIEPIDAVVSYDYFVDQGYYQANFRKNLVSHLSFRATHYSQGRSVADDGSLSPSHQRYGLYFSRRF